MRHGPGDVVRPKSKGELAFSASDVGVTLHTLIAANHSSKELEVSSSSQCIDDMETQEKSQVVLSLAVLSYTELKQMRYWDSKGLSHKLHSDALDKRLTDCLLLPAVLEELYSCGTAGVRPMGDQGTKNVYKDLQQAGVVTLKVNEHGVATWHLTALGKQSTQIGVRLGDAQLLFRPRDVAVTAMDVLDLVLTLSRAAWDHQIVQGRLEIRDVINCPYGVGQKKVWYTRVGQETLSKPYLMSLASAHEHKKPVPHLASADAYYQLLGMPNPLRRKSKIVHVDEDDRGDTALKAMAAAPKRKKRPRPKRAPRTNKTAVQSEPEWDCVF